MRGPGVSATMAAVALLSSTLGATSAGAQSGLLGGLLGGLTPAAAPAGTQAAPPATQLGMNLGVPTYYSGEWAYAELFKNNADFTFNGQLTLPLTLDPGGRPTNVPAGTSLFLGVDFSQLKWRSGNYDCKVSAGWQVTSRFPGTAGTVTQNGTSFTLSIPDTITPGYSVQLSLMATQAGATLDTLACTPTGQPAYAGPLNPAFQDDMKPFGVIRFMDWMKANGGAPTTWANRPLPGDLSMIPRGAAVEDMVDVANRLGADPWFTLPLDADDDYVRQFATYVRDHLLTTRKAYVELSNEVWNPSFQQGRDAISRGKQAYPNDYDQDAADKYYADRVKNFMAIWNSVFQGQMSRIVRVAGTQLFWTSRAETILSHNDTYTTLDAIAGAPYWGNLMDSVPGTGAARVDAYFAQLPDLIEQALQVSVAEKAIADKYKVRLIAYEGGPNMVAYTPDASADMQTVLHDQRLYDAYMTFLKGWQSRVGDTLVLYDSVGAGYYSHKEYTGQPLDQAPKMRAASDFSATLSTGTGLLGGLFKR